MLVYTPEFARAVCETFQSYNTLRDILETSLGDVESISVDGNKLVTTTVDGDVHTVVVTKALITLAFGDDGSPAPAEAPKPPVEPVEEKPKRKRRTKAEIAAEKEAEKADFGNGPGEPDPEQEKGAAEAAADEPEADRCPIDPSHDLNYCEGACEEVARIAQEEVEPDPQPVDEPVEETPAAEGDAPPRFYMTAEETPEGQWRLILRVEGKTPAVRGRFESVGLALKAANDVRLECVGKRYVEAAPIKAIPHEAPF